MLLAVATALYGVNMVIGLAAQWFGVRFGWIHHALYAVVFASAGAALLVNFRAPLLITVAALAVFPWARPRTACHPALAMVGLGGLGLAWIGP